MAVAQGKSCASRAIEETAKNAAARRLGPSAEDILQSIATIGRAPQVTVNVIEVTELGTTALGPSCSATMDVWREDTNETFRAVMQFTIRGNSIAITGLERP